MSINPRLNVSTGMVQKRLTVLGREARIFSPRGEILERSTKEEHANCA